MWRYLVIGDLHWRAENPIGRTDNYQEALAAKLEECWRLASVHNVDAILQTGDLFDSADVAQTTMDDLWDIIERAPAPIYTVPGNHDLHGHNPETLYRAPLGHLFRRRVVVNSARTWYSTQENGAPIIAGHGFDFSTDIDRSQYGFPFTDEMPFLGASIHITHGMLLDGRPSSDKMRWTSLDDVAALPNAPDVLINGHDHIGFGVCRRGRTLFINPGALCRKTADLREMDRPVQVALLEIPERGEPTARLIPLESARPGHEILSREHLIAQAEREQRTSEFLDGLVLQNVQALDHTAMVDEVAQADGVSDAVCEGALRRISKAAELIAARAV